jgi:hypothetical protein
MIGIACSLRKPQRRDSTKFKTLQIASLWQKNSKKPPVERKPPAAIQNYCDTQSDYKEVIFVAFSLLIPNPVHEKTVLDVRGKDDAKHQHNHRGCPNAATEAGNQKKRAEKFDDDDEQSDDPGQMNGPGEEIHKTFETEPAKPAQQMLGAVRKNDKPYREA